MTEQERDARRAGMHGEQGSWMQETWAMQQGDAFAGMTAEDHAELRAALERPGRALAEAVREGLAEAADKRSRN